MKNGLSKLTRFALVLGMPALAVGLRAVAQTPAALDIQVHSGLTITGAVAKVYSIEYVSDLDQTNNESAWRCLEYLQLPARPYLWIDKTAPVTGRRFYRAVQMEAPMNMVFIPPGTFRMGSSTNEVDHWDWESPQTAVTISRGFWMAKYEVTQGEYEVMMGKNPSFFIGDTNRPVESVTWHEATNYCARLTEQERAAGRIATNAVYRLPTEAEWEYACRGWTSTRFSYGDDLGYTELTKHAWYEDNCYTTTVPLGGYEYYEGRYYFTHPVGKKLPNPWGLYDMHGNVWEWCQSWWSSSLSFPGGKVIDPEGPTTGSDRSARGGAIGRDGQRCRSAMRGHGAPTVRGNVSGFRVVLAPGQP